MSLQLKSGMKIIILNQGSTENQYASKIMEVKGRELLILGPMKQGRYVYFPKGSYITISFDSTLYGNMFFDCVIKELIRDNGYLFRVERKTEIVAKQNRDNFRVESSIKVRLTYVKSEKVQTEDTETIDISAGGIRVYSNLHLDKGEELDALIKLDSDEIHTKVKVIRKLDSKSSRYINQYAMGFVDLEELKEDIIVKYLFDYQRMLSAEGRYD